MLQLELQSSPSDERRHHLEAELAHINIKIQVVEERQRLRVKSEFEQSRRKQGDGCFVLIKASVRLIILNYKWECPGDGSKCLARNLLSQSDKVQ